MRQCKEGLAKPVINEELSNNDSYFHYWKISDQVPTYFMNRVQKNVDFIWFQFLKALCTTNNRDEGGDLLLSPTSMVPTIV